MVSERWKKEIVLVLDFKPPYEHEVFILLLTESHSKEVREAEKRKEPVELRTSKTQMKRTGIEVLTINSLEEKLEKNKQTKNKNKTKKLNYIKSVSMRKPGRGW